MKVKERQLFSSEKGHEIINYQSNFKDFKGSQMMAKHATKHGFYFVHSRSWIGMKNESLIFHGRWKIMEITLIWNAGHVALKAVKIPSYFNAGDDAHFWQLRIRWR